VFLICIKKDLSGSVLYAARAQPRAERAEMLRKNREERQNKYQGVNLYIKNLDDSVDEEKLRKPFAEFGTITSVKIMTDDKGHSKGFGFVCFQKPDEATKALTKMNNFMLEKKPLYVALAQRKEQRRAQLEAQHAQRNNTMRSIPSGMGMGVNPLYPGTPLFYGGVGRNTGMFPPTPYVNPQMTQYPGPRRGYASAAQPTTAFPPGATGAPHTFINPGVNRGGQRNPSGAPRGASGTNRGTPTRNTGAPNPSRPNPGKPDKPEIASPVPSEIRKQLFEKLIEKFALEEQTIQKIINYFFQEGEDVREILNANEDLLAQKVEGALGIVQGSEN